MSLPPIGAPIMVTATANGEVGKFIGTYFPEIGWSQVKQFVLRPLPGKRYIEQFPMYPNQELGWNFVFEMDKEEVNPEQLRVDIFNVDRMVFPDGYIDFFDDPTLTFTVTLHGRYSKIQKFVKVIKVLVQLKTV